MSIQIYILSKLIEGNNYPYKLKKELAKPVPFDKLAGLTESKLYYHFESLSKQGFIESVEVIKEDNRPDKQVFAITESGRKELPKKIYTLFEKANKLQEMLIGLIFIHHVDRKKVIEILEHKIDAIHSKLANIKDIHAKLHVEGSTKEVVEVFASYYDSSYKLDIDWLATVIEKLKNEQI
ncbi:PadR family transcriptional regulator [Solibacillus silvestris]|uniref:PadR family transcriptional regulator n=1 Tax=Solibacillus silvestris TaxID=76853 RepID=UPI003F7EDD79